MRRRLFVTVGLAALVGLVAAACGNGGDEVTVPLGEQSASGISGEATLTAADGQTTVVVDLENAGEGPQPIHIHPGTCADLDPTPQYPLTDVTNGASETTVDVSLDALLDGEFAINAHQSPEQLETYVACGDITG